MNSFEFLASFIAIITIIGFGTIQIKNINKLAIEENKHRQAMLEAEKCAIIADSFYANGGGQFESIDISCQAQNSEIFSTKNSYSGKTKTISKAKTFSGENGKTIVEIEVRPHYET